MKWTCAHCGYDRVSWRPRLWTESQVSSLARSRATGQTNRALREGRGFVLLNGQYALDSLIRCPCCKRRFYPGDALERMAVAS